MSFGAGPYGGTPYAGVSFTSTGPGFIFADPVPDATGLAVNVPVRFIMEGEGELDLFSLAVKFNGTQVIIAGDFLPGYGGTITPSGVEIDTIVSTHPDFPDGRPLTVEITVSDLAANSGTYTYTLNIAQAFVAATETVPVVESLYTKFQLVAPLTETVPLIENGDEDDGAVVKLVETVAITESLALVAPANLSGTEILTPLPQECLDDGSADPLHYTVTPLDGGVPVRVHAATPQVDEIASGITGEVTGTQVSSQTVSLPGIALTGNDVGQYVEITGPASSWNIGTRARIDAVISPTTVRLNKFLLTADPDNGSLEWRLTSAVRRVVLTTDKVTNGARYQIAIERLISRVTRELFSRTLTLDAVSPRPQLEDVDFLDDGSIIITFGEAMRIDEGILDVSDYVITGPTAVEVTSVTTVSDRMVRLTTRGIGDGAYTLTINASGTPHDLAGNPIDPTFNQALFSGAVALNERSIFTNKGPIAKPPLTMQSGSGITIHTPTEITCTGGAFGSSAIGKHLRITGSTLNDGSYLVLGVVSATRLSLRANLRVPESGVISWALIDPRDGVIADSPLDVTVTVNGSPVVPEAVSGLRGQIVLASAPLPTDDVKVNYSWVDSPTVEIRGLNSPQFALNRHPSANHATQHSYKYACVLIRPDDYVPAATVQTGTGAQILSTTQILLTGANLTGANVGQAVDILTGVNAGTYTIASISGGDTVTILGTLTYPDPGSGTLGWSVIDFHGDFQAALAQPLERDVKYRAYERAYTAALNDPNLLILNSPSQRIAYPPLHRTVESSFVGYEAVTLPELDPTAPWERFGTGGASIVGNTLVIDDTSSSAFPASSQVFWRRPIDLTFDHAFAAAWRFNIDGDPIEEGVFTGVAIGYSNDKRAFVIGYLDDGGVKKFGVLKKGAGDNPSLITSWTGGVDGSNNSTGLPASLDWTIIHNYRILRDKAGVIRVFVDGAVNETLRVVESELPFLEELSGPFDSLEGIFFGALSRPARSKSTWDFLRYTVIPTNPIQTAPSSFTSYEATAVPEVSTPPWTLVGAHGVETIVSSSVLRLDSTSATTSAIESETGLIGGDFRGFVRMEPLLSASADFTLDVNVKLLTFTHGITPNAVMAAIDDGNRLMQVSFFPDVASAKYSYGGRQLPETWAPVPWNVSGGATAAIRGRVLRVTDTSTTDGRVYSIDDSAAVLATTAGSHACEIRAQVVSYTADPSGFCGVTADTYNGVRVVGIMLRQISGVRYVSFHSDGTPIASGDFAFEWFDGKPHTYKFVVNVTANLVLVFADGTLLGTLPYTSFTSPAASTPIVSWGSATASSVAALSVVDWHYANVWRVYENPKTFVGIWKGTDSNSLTGYHFPVLATGSSATLVGNAFGDPSAGYVAAGVTVGDYVIIDYGTAKGQYRILSVAATSLTLDVPAPFPMTNVGHYRIPRRIDWTADHRYRLVRAPNGDVALFLDSDAAPLIQLDYNNVNFPSSLSGIVRTISGGLPAVAWGAFDPTNISSTQWDFVRYGIVRPPTEQGIVPPHQILNQRNVISSPEHLRSMTPHAHTGYWSSSTGIPPQVDPDLLRAMSPRAFTRLNDDTPPVPVTQTNEIRHPVPVIVSISGLNLPEDVLNTDGDFKLNDPSTKIKLVVPNDVLYNSIQVIESSTGEPDLIAPFDDRLSDLGTLYFQKEHCLVYDGSVLPEADVAAPTTWVLESDNPAQVTASVFSGVLTYGTGGGGTKSIYKNPTSLPDATHFTTEFKFRIKLLNDASLGAGDSQVRFGFSAPGLTFGLGLVTTPLGERYVYVYDLNTGAVVGGIPFDFLDGDFHDYRILYQPGVGAGSVELFIDG